MWCISGGKVDWQCGDITDDRAAIFATEDALYIECDLINIIIWIFVTGAKKSWHVEIFDVWKEKYQPKETSSEFSLGWAVSDMSIRVSGKKDNSGAKFWLSLLFQLFLLLLATFNQKCSFFQIILMLGWWCVSGTRVSSTLGWGLYRAIVWDLTK